MIKKITLDMLNENSVSIKTEHFLEQDGQQYLMGQTHRKAYINNLRGREEVKNEMPIQQQNAIFSIWGDSPTIDESIE